MKLQLEVRKSVSRQSVMLTDCLLEFFADTRKGTLTGGHDARGIYFHVTVADTALARRLASMGKREVPMIELLNRRLAK